MNPFKKLFQRPAIKQEIDDELRFHIEQRTAENIAAGMTPEDAAREARKRFGNLQSVREDCREARRANFGETMMRDLRFAVRQLRKSPGFAAVAVCTLALCIGANLSIFAVVDAILVRPLPFLDSNRLVVLYNTYPKANILRAGETLTSYYQRRHGQISGFASMAIISETYAVVGEPGSTSREEFGRISPDFFSTLGVKLFMGRMFKEEEMTYRTDHEALLSYEYWRSHYDGDPDILGKTVRINGLRDVIVGVLPKGFRFLSFAAPVYGPCSSDENEHDMGARHSNTDKIEVARLAPGMTVAQAQSEVDANNNAHAAEFSQPQLVADSGFRTLVAPLHEEYVSSVRPILLLLQAGVMLLLLIGAVNLVNLLLIRASSRARELGIRQSLGATRRHVVSQVMTETLLLAGAGGLLGLGVGACGIRLLALLGVNQLPLGEQIEFNGRLAVMALLGALFMGFVLSLPMAWFNLRGHLANALRTESRGDTASLAAQRLRHGFIIAQIALAFILLSGAGLLGASLKHALDISPGFQVDHVIAGEVNLPWAGYHDNPSFISFFNRTYDEVSHLPGVIATGMSAGIPISSDGGTGTVVVPGYSAPGASVAIHDILAVGGDYFTAMGIPLREGRYLNQTDMLREERPCVVDENFARRYWPNGGAIGREIYNTSQVRPGDLPLVVVGVVGVVKQASLTDSSPKGALYVPYKFSFSRNYYLVVRTRMEPDAIAGTLRQIVRKIDPELPLTDIRTMDVRIADSLVTRRSPALLAAVFALAALLLAAIGTYGVLSYAVAQRRREIGVRMALGALPSRILRQFLSLGLRLLAVGALLGTAGAWMAGRAMQTILFNVPAFDPIIVAATAAALGTVALVACWLPARRAAKVDPMTALRHE